MPRVSTRARSDLDAPLAEDSKGSRFERFVLVPYLTFVAIIALGAGPVTLKPLLNLR